MTAHTASIALLGAGTLLGCTRPLCTPPDYTTSMCRVQAADQFSHGTDADGVEIRFQDPTTADTDAWHALGRVDPRGDGVVVARVATLGDFRLSVHRGRTPPDRVAVELRNVHPQIPALPGQIDATGTTRHLEVVLDAPVVEIVGRLPEDLCAAGFALAAVGDIQTGPVTFQRVVADLHREAAEMAEAGTPLLGLVLLGDLSEGGTADELLAVADLLDDAPVPVAITPGNHDIYATVIPEYNRVFGPGSYAFDVCDARIVMLDTGSADLAPSVLARLGGWFDHDGRTLIAATHMPPSPVQTTNGWRREDQAAWMMAELADHGGDAVWAGHIHARLTLDQAVVPQIIVGTAGGAQGNQDPDYGYLRAVFRGKVETCFVPVPAPGGAPKDGSPPRCDGS